MKFDVVIGNPPYNKGMDLDFVNIGFELCKKYCVMITPAKWQTAADDYRGCASKTINYKEFRQKLVPHMSKVVFYPDSFDIFDIQQKEGLSYFVIDKNTHDECEVVNVSKLQPLINSNIKRNITNCKTLWNIGNEIIEYLGKYQVHKFKVEYTKRYRVNTGKNMSHGGGHLMSGGGNSGGTGTGGYFFTLAGNLCVVSKSSITDSKSTNNLKQSYTEITFTSDNIQECKSFISWLNCKITRFFVMLSLGRRDIEFTDWAFRFVPAPPSGKFDHIYTDEELYKAFNLPQKYIDVIEAVIKKRD